MPPRMNIAAIDGDMAGDVARDVAVVAVGTPHTRWNEIFPHPISMHRNDCELRDVLTSLATRIFLLAHCSDVSMNTPFSGFAVGTFMDVRSTLVSDADPSRAVSESHEFAETHWVFWGNRTDKHMTAVAARRSLTMRAARGVVST